MLPVLQRALAAPLLRPLVPDWVAAVEEEREKGDLHTGSWDNQPALAEIVEAIDASPNDGRLDVLLWGDSLTSAFMREPQKAWKAHFGDLARTVALGMSGSTIEALAWRLVRGGELPAMPPRVAVLLIGVNNVVRGIEEPAEKLEWLLQWLQATWPNTQVSCKVAHMGP